MNVYEELTSPVALTVFVATLFLPILVGLLTLRRTRSQSDFFVGGRAMDKLVVALSAVSSGRSSWLVLGVSGMAFTRGASAIWATLGYTTVEFFQFIYIGRRLRAETEGYGDITVLDYLESRLADGRHRIRVVGAIVIGVFITAYVAAQFNAGAKTLASALGIHLALALVISAVVILVYMVLGGYIAVAYNDVVRAVIMLLGLVLLPVVGLVRIGGLDALSEILTQLDPGLVDPLSLGFGAFVGFVGIGLGSPGQPHILVRYMSIDDPRNLRTAAVIGTFWNVVLGVGAVTVGMLGRALIPGVESLPEADPEMVYLVLSSEYFGPAMYGLLVGGVFAAILSTADSQLLVVASTVVRDIYEKTLNRHSSVDDATKLALSRVVVVVAGIVAMILAYVAEDLVFWLVLFAWGGLGASLGPAMIFSIYWKRATTPGIVAGMITGALLTIAWNLWLADPTGVYELIPAFLGSALVIVAVSMLGRSDVAPR